MAIMAKLVNHEGPTRPMTGRNGLARVASMDDEEPMTRVREIKEARGINSAELAKRAKMDPSTLSKVETGIRNVTKNTGPKLAEALAVPIEALHASVGSPIPAAPLTPSGPTYANVRIANDAPLLPDFTGLKRDVEVFGTAQGGAEGAFIINMLGGPIGWAWRPPGLVGVAGVFAVYVEGDSMVPWRRPGALVYVHPHKHPDVGCHVVVELEAPPGDPPLCMVKELVKLTASRVELRQHNPVQIIQIERARVRRILRVMEWEEMMAI